LFNIIKHPNDEYQRPCGSAKVEDTSCDPVVITPQEGSEPFSIVAGKYMYLNGYEILITAPNEGLLYLPLIRSRIPVEWSNLTVYKNDEEDYGCVTEGEARMQGSQTGAIARDLHRQVLALLTRGPGSFSGKFGEALEKISAVGDSLKNGQTVNWAYTKGVLDAAKTGYEEWKTQVNSYFTKDGATIPPAVQDILAGIQAKQDKYQQLSACVVQNIPSGGGGNAVPKRLKAAIFACTLTDEDENEMIVSKTDAQADIDELSLFDTDADPVGPVFNKNNGDFLGGTKEGALSGKLYFIEPNKLFELEEKYGIGTPKLVSSKVMKKYGEGYDMGSSTDKTNSKIKYNALKYIVNRTDLKMFTIPSDAKCKLQNCEVSVKMYVSNDMLITENSGIWCADIQTLPNVDACMKGFYPESGVLTFTHYMATVEEIQNTYVHEFVGHYIMKYSNSTLDHYKAYEIQMSHPTWSKLSEEIKNLIIKKHEKCKNDPANCDS
jgi:hypothetical protein